MKYRFHLILAFSIFMLPLFGYDLTLVGLMTNSDGIGKISIDLINELKDDLEINCIPSFFSPVDVNDEAIEIIIQPDKTPGTVSLLMDGLWHKFISPPLYTHTPDSKIKIAYSMLESSRIPPEWVEILNAHFDAVVVPDPFLVEVYTECGVHIPIFILPIGMNLEDYFQAPRKQPSKPFVFGTTVSCDERKNFTLLIKSFAELFKNNQKVILKINSRQGDFVFYENLIRSLGISNIVFTNNILDKKNYILFLNSFDCFINLSKGEGFSLCPREALALGKPCILTRNSAQITICDSGLVRVVPSLIPEPAYYGVFGDQPTGVFYTCTEKDFKDALQDVFENYTTYQKKAKKGPEWVSQYSWSNLKKKYLNLIKPQKILFGERNEITKDYFMTNSPELFEKYTNVFLK